MPCVVLRSHEGVLTPRFRQSPGPDQTYEQAAFRDGNIVWGRVAPDIPAFCRELVQALSES